MVDGGAPDEPEAKLDEQPSVLQKLQKWGDCVAYGEPVAPTRFLPMKTPLGREILAGWNLPLPPAQPLTVEGFAVRQRDAGRRVGMIIDLSNHETLYGADLQRTAIAYERVPLVAKVFPSQRAVNRVIEIAERFWAERPEDFIAIHCAYGFNRTGFVVCSFLVQACCMTVAEALDSFAAARPPGVRHEQFVAELQRRYGGLNQQQQALPQPPSLSDLRGYGARQTVASLQSDFLGVAEHLQDSLATPAARGAADGQASPEPGLPPLGSPPGPLTLKRGGGGGSARRGQLLGGGGSARSLEGRGSACESVNNESLDLDEREIYRHFAHRQLAGVRPSPTANGHHRRKAVPPLLPHIQQSDGGSGHSSCSGSQRSPFAAAAQASGAEEPPSEASLGRTSESGEQPAAAEAGEPREPCAAATQPLPIPAAQAHGGLAAPLSAVRIRDTGQPDASDLAKLQSGAGEERTGGARSRRQLLPCRVM